MLSRITFINLGSAAQAVRLLLLVLTVPCFTDQGANLRSGGKGVSALHTTEKPGMQSVLEANDLTEIMTMVGPTLV